MPLVLESYRNYVVLSLFPCSVMQERCVLVSSSCERPRIIEALRGKEIIDIACGGAHSAAITCHRDVYTWGKGRYGRLGHGDSEDQLKPKLVGKNCCKCVKCVDNKCPPTSLFITSLCVQIFSAFLMYRYCVWNVVFIL